MKALKTLNHKLTQIQINELTNDFQIDEILELCVSLASQLKELTIDSDIENLANELIEVIKEYDYVLLPCGSPLFAFVLARKFESQGIATKALFAHSDRESKEKIVSKKIMIVENGETVEKTFDVVEKITVFNHVKWMVI